MQTPLLALSIATGVFFCLWPLRMNQSGLPGPAAMFVYACVTIVAATVMLLLSNGLVTSMRDLLERSGFDVRVTATDNLPGGGPMIANASDAARAIAALPSVRAALTIRFAEARLEQIGRAHV